MATARKVKLSMNVVHEGVIHPKDKILNVNEATAEHLVANGFAAEVKEPKPKGDDKN